MKGRQPPVPGSRRYQNMQDAKRILRKGEVPRSYKGLADRMGVTVQQAQRAVDDINWHDPEMVVPGPSASTNFRLSAQWSKNARPNEKTQQRHLATRLETSAKRTEKEAAQATNPAMAMMLRQQAANDRLAAQHRREFIDAL